MAGFGVSCACVSGWPHLNVLKKGFWAPYGQRIKGAILAGQVFNVMCVRHWRSGVGARVGFDLWHRSRIVHFCVSCIFCVAFNAISFCTLRPFFFFFGGA